MKFTIKLLLLSSVLLSIGVLESCSAEETEDLLGLQNVEGTYQVSESTNLLFQSDVFQTSNFTGIIERGTKANEVNLIQTDRMPMPEWVDSFTDTMQMRYIPDTDSLESIVGGVIFGTILSPDSLSVRYLFGAGSRAYEVNQIWAKFD